MHHSRDKCEYLITTTTTTTTATAKATTPNMDLDDDITDNNVKQHKRRVSENTSISFLCDTNDDEFVPMKISMEIKVPQQEEEEDDYDDDDDDNNNNNKNDDHHHNNNNFTHTNNRNNSGGNRNNAEVRTPPRMIHNSNNFNNGEYNSNNNNSEITEITITSSIRNNNYDGEYGNNNDNDDGDSSSPRARRRISVNYQGKVERVIWYGEDEPSLQSLEGTLKKTFNLPPNTSSLHLRNSEGDEVAFNSKLSPHEQFTLEVLFDGGNGNNMSSSMEFESDNSSSPETPEEFQSDSTSTPKTPSPNSVLSPETRNDPNSESPLDTQFVKIEPQDDQRLKREGPATAEELSMKKKRKRRKAIEIDRAYKCTLGVCRKVYGSENALKMHIKIKHPDQQNVGHHPYLPPHPYNMFVQPQANHYPPNPIYSHNSSQPQQPLPHSSHPQHPPVSRASPTPTPPPLPSIPNQFPNLITFYPTTSSRNVPHTIMNFPTVASSRSPFNPPFPSPAPIREPNQKPNAPLPTMQALPTLQPSHLPTIPYCQPSLSRSVSPPLVRGGGHDEVIRNFPTVAHSSRGLSSIFGGRPSSPNNNPPATNNHSIYKLLDEDYHVKQKLHQHMRMSSR